MRGEALREMPTARSEREIGRPCVVRFDIEARDELGTDGRAGCDNCDGRGGATDGIRDQVRVRCEEGGQQRRGAPCAQRRCASRGVGPSFGIPLAGRSNKWCPSVMSRTTPRELSALMVCAACAAAQYSALLPLLPLAVRGASGNTAGAGVVTAAVGLGAISGELQTPTLMRRCSPKKAFRVGLGATCCALAGIAAQPPLLVMISFGVLFGLGFGVTVAVGSAVVGGLAQSGKDGAGLAVYGWRPASRCLRFLPSLCLHCRASVSPRCA